MSAPLSLLPENDPCTTSYQRAPRTSIKQSVKIAFIRTIKRILRIKPKDSPTFVMLAKEPSTFVTPVEYKRVSQSSAHSRRSVVSMKMASKTNLIPVTTATGTPTPSPRHSRLYVHMYCGTNSPPPAEKVSVRFSHPAVSKFTIVHSTSETPTPSKSGPEDYRPSTQDSDTSDGLPTIAFDDEGAKLLIPGDVFRETNQSVTSEGKRETWDDFKSRFDGHTRRADRVSEQAPKLPCINSMKADSSAVAEAGEVEAHRSNALSALEGSGPTAVKKGYVLAIMPKTDLRMTAIQVDSAEVPSSLIPGGKPNPYSATARPHTFHGRQVFEAYNPSKARLSSKANQVVSQSKDLLEMPKFDSEKHSNRTSRHSKHYRAVESGDFGDSHAKSTSMHLHAPAPGPHAMSTPSFLLPPSPPKPTHRQTLIPRKPVATPQPTTNFSKPLPPLPAAAAPTKIYKAYQPSKPVEPFQMNENGYQILAPRRPSKRFSEEPKYQRRTIDDVEAKFRKERAGKRKEVSKAKSADELLRAAAGEEKRMVTLTDVQGMKTEKVVKKRSGLGALEEGLKVLMLS